MILLLALRVDAVSASEQSSSTTPGPDGESPIRLRMVQDIGLPVAPPPVVPAHDPEPPPQLRLGRELGGPPASRPAEDRVLPLEVTINGQRSGTWLLIERSGELYAPRDAIEEWRLLLADNAPSINFRGEPYWSLSAVPGYRARLDLSTQSVELVFSPAAFAATRLTGVAARRPVVSPALPSLFFNYDASYTASAFRDAPSLNDLGVLTEAGVSTGLGVLISTGAGRNLADDPLLGKPTWTRLETTFTKDFPDNNYTLRIGDARTRGGMLGRDVYFGGIQYGTNFALTPGYISQPLPVLTGLSSAPSAVELYVNDVLRQVSRVPTGPFTLGNFPVMSGGGEVRLVVRDVLGRETVIVQPFFTSTELLAEGLNDWRVEAGGVRRDFGTASNHYGPGFVRGSWRHGYTNSLTVEGRAEATKDLRTLWLGAAPVLPGQFLGKFGLVGSQEDTLGSGSQWIVGAERPGLRSGLNIEARGATADFRQVGLDVGVLPNKEQVAGNWTYTTDKAGTFGLGYASISRYDAGRVTTVSANYTIRIGARASLIAYASRAMAETNADSVGVTFVLPLENFRIYSVTAGARSGGQRDLYATVSQTPVDDAGLGWRLLGGWQQDRERAEAGATYLGRYGTASSEISTSRDQTTVRVGATGGLALADGHLFASRRLDDSFGLAEVPGYGNVGIGLGGRMLTRTNADGVALIPSMIAYQNNSVRIDPGELPINAELDSIEQVAVPAWRSAVKVTFPVRSGRGALLRIVFDDGEVAPAGAIVQIEGDKQEFYVARRGEAFVTGLQTSNRLLLTWNNRKCQFEVTLPPPAPDDIPQLGPFLCKGIAR